MFAIINLKFIGDEAPKALIFSFDIAHEGIEAPFPRYSPSRAVMN
jgi:hypothetical protein